MLDDPDIPDFEIRNEAILPVRPRPVYTAAREADAHTALDIAEAHRDDRRIVGHRRAHDVW